MPAKQVALFVDVESLHHQLRTLHHRPLDPLQLLDAARARGALGPCVAVADWRALPESAQASFAAVPGIERVQVDRRLRGDGGRRREVVRDLVLVELLARAVELAGGEAGAAIDVVALATGDGAAARVAAVVRERLRKDVHVIGAEGGIDDELKQAASSWEALSLPPLAASDLEGLAKLVPLLEELEQRKRYLNFKFIRETVARRLDLPDRSFERAERLLSEAIGCGLLLKHKIEDKYDPGQLFTAYALHREHELFARFGSGRPAPVHDAPEPALADAHADADDRAADRAADRAEDRAEEEAGEQRPGTTGGSRDDGGDQAGGARRKRRRRRRKGGGPLGPGDRDAGSTAGSERDAAGAPVPDTRPRREAAPPEPLPVPSALSAGAAARGKRRGAKHHAQDRLGRTYEAPSRFLDDGLDLEPRFVHDDEIDEERILQALQDL